MESVQIEKSNFCLNVTLNRPEIHNAFEPKMIKRLTDVFRSATTDKSIRCVLLKGNGKSFCAGADIEWMKSMVNFDLNQNIKDSTDLFEMFDAIRSCAAPVIARAQGNIMGGGLGLLAACDLVGAYKESRFCFSEVKLGLVPSVISSFVLRKASPAQARELMLTGEIFDCEKSMDLGLVHFSAEPEEVDDFIQSKIDFICGNGPEAVRETKRILNFYTDHDQAAIKKETIKTIAERRVSSEGQEGLKSFLEKRKPNW